MAKSPACVRFQMQVGLHGTPLLKFLPGYPPHFSSDDILVLYQLGYVPAAALLAFGPRTSTSSMSAGLSGIR